MEGREWQFCEMGGSLGRRGRGRSRGRGKGRGDSPTLSETRVRPFVAPQAAVATAAECSARQLLRPGRNRAGGYTSLPPAKGESGGREKGRGEALGGKGVGDKQKGGSRGEGLGFKVWGLGEDKIGDGGGGIWREGSGSFAKWGAVRVGEGEGETKREGREAIARHCRRLGGGR